MRGIDTFVVLLLRVNHLKSKLLIEFQCIVIAHLYVSAVGSSYFENTDNTSGYTKLCLCNGNINSIGERTLTCIKESPIQKRDYMESNR